jgi:hypothetical protein
LWASVIVNNDVIHAAKSAKGKEETSLPSGQQGII